MNASVNVERNSWRLPPDETVQVADPRSKSAQVKEVNRSSGSPCGPPPNRRILAVDCVEIRFGCMIRVPPTRCCTVSVINLRASTKDSILASKQIDNPYRTILLGDVLESSR
jgi:hypothetical protein